MSLFFRGAAASEARAISSLPFNYGGSSSSDGSMSTQLGLVPVFAASRLISDAVASLPLQAYRKTANGRQSVSLPVLFEAPGRVDWLQRCMLSLLLRGNAYGLKVYAVNSSALIDIEWLNPDDVRWDDGAWWYRGREVPADLMLHIPAMCLPGSKLGLSPLGACAATVTTGIETQRFMRSWFRNKAIPGMVFKNTEQTLDASVAGKVKERMQATIQAGEPFVTGKDWELDVITLPADHAGFVESAKLNATQIATIYGVPPEMIGGETGASMTYSTTEQQQIQFLTNTLRPWLVRLESAFTSLLPRGQYVRFNADAMIRVDTKTRHEVYKIDREIGLQNIDELRALEDWAPLPNGEGQDYTPLGRNTPAPIQENNQ